MKKAVALAAAAVLAATAAGALAGCGEGSSSGGKSGTINILLLTNTNETAIYRQYFKEMEEQLKEEGLNYSIEFNGMQDANYYNRLLADINRGSIPDIFYVRPNELLQYRENIASLQSYADSQTEVNLSDIYPRALNMYRFNPATGEIGNEKDELYAFPKDLSTQQLGYNKSLLQKYEQKIEAAGYTMPWDMDFTQKTYTWEEYKNICKIIADEAAAARDTVYASDVPSIEVLAHSFGGELIDLSNGRANGKVSSLTDENGAMYKAIQYQKDLIACGAADYTLATYANFTSGRVCFYGLVATWEIAEYNEFLNEDVDDNWQVMPWPTVDGSTNWQGVITSAGYVVSKQCAESEKGDVAKRIAISFLSSRTQNRFVRDEKIALPLIQSWEADYTNPENDNIYSPKTRSVFLDVISGRHGFLPAKYSTYDDLWISKLDDALGEMYKAGKSGVEKQYNDTDWAKVEKDMQDQYDVSKNK